MPNPLFTADDSLIEAVYIELNSTGLVQSRAYAWLAAQFSNAMHGNYSPRQLFERGDVPGKLEIKRRTGSTPAAQKPDFDGEGWPLEALFDKSEVEELFDAEALAVFAAQFSNSSKNWYSARQLFDRLDYLVNEYSIGYRR